jgi:lipoprotein-anchoring transpeptidase ErfK/SrfK
MKRAIFVVSGVLAVVLIIVSFAFFSKVRKNVAQGKITASEETLFHEAEAQLASGDLIKARELYQKLIRDYPQGKGVPEAQKATWALNVKILFSPIQTPDSKIYEVQPRDTLGKIAKTSGTTVDLIMKSNSLKSDLIRPGMKLKVSTAKYSILVDKSQNTLTLSSGEEIFKIYNVATGLDNSTPIGTFKVTNKIIDPTWYKAGAIVPPGSPKNILGTRWLGLSMPGYGIHGTTEPESIGKQVTAGCVRMVNQDVEELYTIVPTGTEVVIAD